MEKIKEVIRSFIKNGTVKTEGVRKRSIKYKIDKNTLATMWLIEKQNIEDEKLLGKAPEEHIRESLKS